MSYLDGIGDIITAITIIFLLVWVRVLDNRVDTLIERHRNEINQD